MNSSFSDSKLLLTRAKKHLDELKFEELAFSDGKPYTSIIDVESDPLNDVYKLQLTSPIPSTIKAIVADSINNIRASLDHAVCASVKLFGRSANVACFPFAESVLGLENTIKGRCKEVHPEIVSLMREFKPYKGGNDLLWSVSKISALNKHQSLLALNAKYEMTDWQIVANRPPEPITPFWNSAKDEFIFAVMSKGGQLTWNIYITLYITFGDVEIVRFQPLVSTINEMIGIAQSIVSDIEAASCRILGMQ